MARFRMKNKISIGRIISKVVGVAIALWVGSSVLNALAVAMNQTSPVFYTGFTFVGFGGASGTLDGTVSTTGILSILGIVGFASVVMEFVSIKL